MIILLLAGCDTVQEANKMGAMADSTQQDTTTTNVSATRDANGREAALVSAFFGLDNGLPRLTNRVICRGASGKDGMPVIFSHEVDIETLQAGDFRVTTESGAIGDILCVTPAPAADIGELRTILIVGEYGSAEDQPVSVEIIGNVLSKDRQVNFIGARTTVIALEEGPTIEWSEIVPESEWELGKAATSLPFGGGDGCPLDTKQVVRVTWAGGVTKPGGDEIDDIERKAYRVTMSFGDEGETEVVPFAIGDLGDGDNNHELCLDRAGSPLRVDFPAGLLTDPREDLNPGTKIEVTS
ncbi:MAG: hypothetical protein ACR2QL_02035 [Woeseiaceae bacterium]